MNVCALCGQEADLAPNGLCPSCVEIDSFQKPAEPETIIERLEAASDLDEITAVLSSHQPPADRMEQAVLREKALKAIKGKAKSPAKLIDAWLGSATSDGGGAAEEAAGLLVNLALENATLFHSPGQEGFAIVQVDDHRENHRIRSSTFGMWLRKLWFEEYRSLQDKRGGQDGGLLGLLALFAGGVVQSPAPPAQAVRDAVAQLEGLAVFDGDEQDVFVRVAYLGVNRIYLDLGRENWEAVEVTPDGWRIVSDPPVRFVRAPGMEPLPHPEPGVPLSELRRFVNVTDEDWPLIAGFVAGLLMPRGPFPVLNLLGEQGSAKTSSARRIRRLVDPYSPLDRGRPRSEHELAIAAEWAWCLSFDNLGSIPDWLSDAFCRISTGGGFGARRLYTDDEERRFDAERPLILNGISDIATRGDLLDRSLVVTLPQLEVRDHAQVEAEFEKAWPSLLGACLDAASTALARRQEVQLRETPRMADFARWATAAEPALGLEDGEFLDAYLTNRQTAHRTAVEADPVAVALEMMMEDRDTWEGTATELHEALELQVSDHTLRSRDWPKAANALGGRLRRIAPDIRRLGIDITFPSSRTHGRILHVTRERKNRPSRPDRPEETP